MGSGKGQSKRMSVIKPHNKSSTYNQFQLDCNGMILEFTESDANYYWATKMQTVDAYHMPMAKYYLKKKNVTHIKDTKEASYIMTELLHDLLYNEVILDQKGDFVKMQNYKDYEIQVLREKDSPLGYGGDYCGLVHVKSGKHIVGFYSMSKDDILVSKHDLMDGFEKIPKLKMRSLVLNTPFAKVASLILAASIGSQEGSA